MSQPIRVVVADDHPIFRKGLREIIEEDPGLAVVGECSDGETALAAILEHAPDIAVLDLDMPVRDGFGVVRGLAEAGLQVPVVLLTMHGREDLLRAAMDAGVLGYVVKDGAVTDIVQAIRAVLAGRPYISSSLSASLLGGREAARAAVVPAPPAPAPVAAAPGDPDLQLDRLTPAERRVLRLIAEFKTSKEIADELGVHYRTIENHRTNISQKLGLTGSHSLTRFAGRHRDKLV